MDQLRRRLEETEKAMERICRQMGNVADRLSPSIVAELLAPRLAEDKVSVIEPLPQPNSYGKKITHFRQATTRLITKFPKSTASKKKQKSWKLLSSTQTGIFHFLFYL